MTGELDNRTSHQGAQWHQAALYPCGERPAGVSAPRLPGVLVHAWRYQILALTEKYTVVAPDLRGYGYSAKPFDGYDKRTMATDIRELTRHLGFEQIALVGHDRVARVALRFMKDSPEMVDRIAVLDNVPTVVIFETMDAQYALGQWWFLLNQIPHLPEALIAGREELFPLPCRTGGLRLLTTTCSSSTTLPSELASVRNRAYRWLPLLDSVFILS